MIACIQKFNFFSKKKKILTLLVILLKQYDLNATFLFSSSLGYGRMHYMNAYLTPIASEILFYGKKNYVLRLNTQSELEIPIFFPSERPHNIDIMEIKPISKKINCYPSGLIELKSNFSILPLNFEFLYETPNQRFRFGLGMDLSILISSKFQINIYKDQNFKKNPNKVINLYKDNKERIINLIPDMNLEELKYLKKEIEPYTKIDKHNSSLFNDILEKIEKQEQSENLKKKENKNLNNTLGYYKPPKKTFFSYEPYLSFKFKIFDKKYISIFMDLNYFPIMFTFSSVKHLYRTNIHSYSDTNSYINNLGGISLGISLEKKISEYFCYFIKFQLKNYNINKMLYYIPYTTRIINFTTQIGFLFGYPEVQRCKIDMCRVQIKHRHSNSLYRGSPFYTEKDSMGIKLLKPKTINEEKFKPKRKKYIEQYKQELRP